MKCGLDDSFGFDVAREYLKDVCPESAKVVGRSGREAVIFLPGSSLPGTPISLHVSPSGEVKHVRGPSGISYGANQSSANGFHESRNTKHGR